MNALLGVLSRWSSLRNLRPSQRILARKPASCKPRLDMDFTTEFRTFQPSTGTIRPYHPMTNGSRNIRGSWVECTRNESPSTSKGKPVTVFAFPWRIYHWSSPRRTTNMLLQFATHDHPSLLCLHNVFYGRNYVRKRRSLWSLCERPATCVRQACNQTSLNVLT